MTFSSCVLKTEKGAKLPQPIQTPPQASTLTSFPIPTQTPEVFLTPTPDETAGWKSYTNTKYGFLVKYPQYSNVREISPQEGDEIVEIKIGLLSSFQQGPLPKNWEYSIFIGEIKNPQKKNLKEAILGGMSEEERKLINFSEEKLGSYRVFKTSDFPSSSGQLAVFFETSDGARYISFRFLPYNPQSPYENQPSALSVFNLMFSTFKFLD